MRARVWLLALLVLLAPLSAGCVDALDRSLRGEEAADEGLRAPDARIYDFFETNVSIDASDGVTLRATLMQPDAFVPDERFPAVVFVHGWGGDRGTGAKEAPVAQQMRALARDGYAVLAYDVRGFGESGGNSTLAGPREMQDMREVVDWLVNATPWNGKLGVVGRSYGGAHAMWALVHDERVTTVVSHYGWIDLGEGLAPGGIVKQAWVGALMVGGTQGGGRYDPVLYEWLRAAVTREEFHPVLDELAARSTFRDLPNVTKPVFLVEGTDETLFPQALRAYRLLDNASARHVFLYPGGHGSHSEEAWARTHQWLDRHLQREDAGVDEWPAVAMPRPGGTGTLTLAQYPPEGLERRTLLLSDATPGDGEGELVPTEPAPEARGRFTGTGRSGATDDPAVLRDAMGVRGASAPTKVRAAPGEALVFRGEPLDEAVLVLGPPSVSLIVEPSSPDGGHQVVVRLYAEGADGASRLVARGGLDPEFAREGAAAADGRVTLQLTRALERVEAGERFVLVVAGDDTSYTAPYPTPFSAEAVFGGDTGARVEVPVVAVARG